MADKLLHRLQSRQDALMVGNLYVKAVPPPDLNKNTSWFQYPGVWTTYILIIFVCWLLILSVFGCTAGTAWTAVNLTHAAVSDRMLLPPCVAFALATAECFCRRVSAYCLDNVILLRPCDS